LVGHAVELSSGLDKGVTNFRPEGITVPWEDAYFSRNGGGGARVLSCEHVHFDAGLHTFSDSVFGFETRWVVETNKTKEDKALFNLVSWNFRVPLNGFCRRPLSDSKHSQALISKHAHLTEHLVLYFRGHLFRTLTNANRRAKIKHTLYSAFSENHAFTLT